MARILRIVVGTFIVLLSGFFVVKSARFFSLSPEVLGKYVRLPWAIAGHIAGGMTALLTGPFQLSKRFRAKYRQAHRVMGRFYVGGVTLGGLCAITLTSTTALSVGGAYVLSLYMLATVWLVSTLLAWRFAVKRQMARHEEWANRSYIATVAFVLQATTYELPFVMRLGSLAEVAPTLIWLSWTVPMFAYDVMRRPLPARTAAAAAASTAAAAAAAPAAISR